MTRSWGLELGRWKWVKENLSSADRTLYRWSAVYEEPSPRLKHASDDPARCILIVRCVRHPEGKAVGEVLRTSQGLLALRRVRRPSEFILDLEKTKPKPRKIQSDRIVDPHFLDEVENLEFVCPRCGPGRIETGVLEAALGKGGESAGFLFELPRRGSLSR
jgi:hypothetical protein